MERYEKLDEKRDWKQEYRTVQDPVDFLALHAYSPYHNLKDDQNYPSILFVSGRQGRALQSRSRTEDGSKTPRALDADKSPAAGLQP